MHDQLLLADVQKAIGYVLAVLVLLGFAVAILVNMRKGRAEVGSEIELAANRKPYLEDDELETKKLDRTLGFQADRDSPFSIWGGAGGLQLVVQIAAAGLAVAVAFVPRRRDTATVAALAAAVLIAAQIGADHWFYLYVPWFFGAYAVGMIAGAPSPEELELRNPREPASGSARSNQPVPAG